MRVSPMNNGDDLKRDGIDKVSSGHDTTLLRLQLTISMILRAQPTVTSDDVYAMFGPLPSWVNKNIMGAAFSKHPSIRKTGEMVKSKRPEAHSRMIAVWQRK